jgi:6-phosphofructokinase
MYVKKMISGPTVEHFRKEGLKIGILHSGGPAPGGNKVIYAAAMRAMDHSIGMQGFRNGYKYLTKMDAQTIAGDKMMSLHIDREIIRYVRDNDALVIKTSRDNPGKPIKSVADMDDPEKTKSLTKVLETFEALRIGALVSIGGDDTLRTANLLETHMNSLRSSGRSFKSFMGIVHVPKTIDNDYPGIAFTFGYMSAAEFIGEQIAGFHSDAKSRDAWHVVEVMGRDAGWLSAGAAIYGQATYTIIPEDYAKRGTVTIEELANDCVDAILTREKEYKPYGVIAIAEGLGDKLPKVKAKESDQDSFGHTMLDKIDLNVKLKEAVEAEYTRRTGGKKLTMVASKAGYNARQVEPNFYDTILSLRLGTSAVDAILQGRFGHMVSVEGPFNVKYVPFQDLVDPITLKTQHRNIPLDGGFNDLLRAMEQPFESDVDVAKKA